MTLLLLPLMLYRIHLATTRLVLESDNLKHWWMVTSSRTSSPMQMAQAVVPSYNASTVAQSTSTSDPSTVEEITAYSLQCGADQIIQQIITEKLKQVRFFIFLDAICNLEQLALLRLHICCILDVFLKKT